MLHMFLGRALDRKTTRPPGLTFAMDDTPPAAFAIGLALQHVAIQSIYLVIPVIVAGALSSDPGNATRFLCLSLLGAAVWQILQLLPKGPLGSGYPIPGTNSAATVGGYVLVAATGGSFNAASAAVVVTGLVLILLTFVMHRIRVFLPNEVAGVVVILIGVALLMLSARRLGLTGTDAPPDPTTLLAMFGSLSMMVALALSGTRAAPFAVLVGALAGIPLAIWLGHAVPNGHAVLAARPWFALPQPWLPDFGGLKMAPLVAFLVSIVALKATALGSLVVVQRATDASWTLPDPRPIRRGLLANGVAVVLAGLLGGALPGPATAAAGLSIATGTMARRIVWVGAAMLVVLALFPKIVALFVLVPYPVQAAMLFYVSGFIMAQGCQLVTARLLDTRRMLIVAFGLSAGLMVGLAPHAFETWVPAIASPVSFGALIAFLVNLITLPLVRRRAQVRVKLGAGAERQVTEWFGTLGGAWGLKAQTERLGHEALTEYVDIFRERELPDLDLAAIRGEDRVEIRMTWLGPALPIPARRPDVEDLLGERDAREGFSVWMATSRAQGFTQRAVADGTEATLILED